jgi:exosortase/archaeosortase family protein
MNSVMSSGGRFYNEYVTAHFNYIQGLKTMLIVPAVWIIKLFGFYAIHNESDVLVVSGPYLRVNYACLGLGVMSFLVAFVIAFPAKLKAKWQLLVFGIIMIYVLNMLRIAALGILLGYFKSTRNEFKWHHEIFNILVYICVFVVLYYWIKKNTKLISKEKKEIE